MEVQKVHRDLECLLREVRWLCSSVGLPTSVEYYSVLLSFGFVTVFGFIPGVFHFECNCCMAIGRFMVYGV